MDDERLTMTISEVAKRLGLGRNSVYAAVARGEIPVIKCGKRLLISKYVLEKMLQPNAFEYKGVKNDRKE